MHKRFADVMLSEYAGKFSDGAPGNWKPTYRNHEWRLKLPNGVTIALPSPIGEEYWRREILSDADSTRLWLRSLKYLAYFDRAGEPAWNEIVSTVISFSNWLESYSADWSALQSGSLDHQVALRLRTACTLMSLSLRHQADERTHERLEVALRSLVEKDVQIVDALELFAENNHGIMLAVGILHASIFFPTVIDEETARSWLAQLHSALTRIVDEDGLAPENTVSYQIFYVNLLEQISSFINWAGLEFDGAKQLLNLAENAIESTRKLVLPDGAVPPIGDSPGGRQARFKHKEGALFSPSNGFYVNSDGSTYFMIKSGYRSVIHKQMDDGSVLLWKDGYFILRDAGLLSYDKSDEVAVAIRGQRGHSATVLERFDSMNAMRMVGFSNNSSRMDGFISEDLESPFLIDVSSTTLYDGVPTIERRVSSRDRQDFRIVDRFIGREPERVVTRFLLDERASAVQLAANVLTYTLGSMRVRMALCTDSIADYVDNPVSLVESVIGTAPYKRTTCATLKIVWGEARPGAELSTVVTIES